MTTARVRLLLLFALVVVVTVLVVACEPPPEVDRRYETVLVLGDAVRDAVGVDEAPPSSVAVEVWVPDPALCHAEARGAVAVSDAIRAVFAGRHWEWACRVAFCESRFDQGAVGRYGEIGVFQVYPKVWGATAKRLGFDIYTLRGNAQMAAHILAVQGPGAWTCK